LSSYIDLYLLDVYLVKLQYLLYSETLWLIA